MLVTKYLKAISIVKKNYCLGYLEIITVNVICILAFTKVLSE